jgi:hypothetical protein
MTNAFDHAAAILFADPNMSQAATYRPAAGGSSTIRACPVDEGDRDQSLLGGAVRLPAMLVDVLKSAVSQPVKGDQIDLTAPVASFKVASWKAAEDQISWRLSLDRA